MAINSAVIMPLKQCCLTRINKMPSSWDLGVNYSYCKDCNTCLMYKNNAWQEKPKDDRSDWYHETVIGRWLDTRN